MTVMLPAKDAAKTLFEAAESCLAQTFENLELVLIENDSSPETLEVMKSLKKEDSRVRIVHCQSGVGFVPSLNEGLSQARGRFLARMDADDICYPRRIQAQVEMLRAEPSLSGCGTLVEIVRRGNDGRIQPAMEGYAEYGKWLNSVCDSKAIFRERFVDSPIANPSSMVRREVFALLGGYRKVAWAEDYDFWLRVLESGYRLAKVPDVLLTWVDSDLRLTRNDAHYSQERFLEAKAHFLGRIVRLQSSGVGICGAGPIGKRLARLLAKEGIQVNAFYEVSARRIGNRIHGIPVLDGENALPAAGTMVMLGAVGLPGARERIRGLLQPLGYREGEDFFCVA